MTAFIQSMSFLMIRRSPSCSITTTSPRRPRKTTSRRPRLPVTTSVTSLSEYIKENDVLAPEDERELLTNMQFLRDEASLQATLSHKPTDIQLAATLEIPISNVPLVRQKALQARNELVAAHIRLVMRIASRVRRAAGAQPPALHDLVQEGCFALLRAAEKFDPNRQVRFVSYAKTAVTRACSRAARPAGHVLEVPERLRVAVGKKKKERIEKGSLHRDDVKDDTDQDHLVTLAERQMRSGLSLAEVVVKNSDGDLTLMDLLPSQRRLPEQVIQGEMIRDEIKRACRRRLKNRQADMVELRFGLNGDPPLTGSALGKKYGLSQARVAQIVLAALETLRETEPELEQLMYEL